MSRRTSDRRWDRGPTPGPNGSIRPTSRVTFAYPVRKGVTHDGPFDLIGHAHDRGRRSGQGHQVLQRHARPLLYGDSRATWTAPWSRSASSDRLLLYKSGYQRGETTYAAFLCEDVEGTVRELRGKGVKFEEYDFPGLKTVNGIATSGDMKTAWLKDSEGNTLAISNEAAEVRAQGCLTHVAGAKRNGAAGPSLRAPRPLLPSGTGRRSSRGRSAPRTQSQRHAV